MTRTGAVVRPVVVGAVAVAAGLYGEWAYARTGAAPAELARDLVVGWTFVGAGLVARWRCPGSRTGLLMIAEGLTWYIGNLQGAGLPFLVAAGAWLESLNDAVLCHLVLSFPTGRLDTRLARLLVGAAYAAVLVVGLLRALTFDPATDGWATYLSCPRCGPNALLVDPNPALFAAIDLSYRSLGGALAVACAVSVARRWLASSRLARRALLPTWAVALVMAMFVGWDLLHTLEPRTFGKPSQPVLWAADLSQLVVAVALLWGLLRTCAQPPAGAWGRGAGDAPGASHAPGASRPATGLGPDSSLLGEQMLLDAVSAAISTLSTLQRIDAGLPADTTVRDVVATASAELQLAIDELEDLARRRRTLHGP
jgi:hypothetical protein